MIEDNEGLELVFSVPLPSRAFIYACGHFWRVSRVSLDGLKRERLLVAGNKALVVMHSRVKLARIALTPQKRSRKNIDGLSNP